MKQHTLLIDMDSVITDLMSKWFSRYNRDYNDHLAVKDLTCWATHEFVREECGQKIYDYLSEPGFYRNLMPINNAIAVLKRLHQQYTIFIVTTSPKVALQDKADWVDEYLPFIGSEQIIFTHFKGQIKGDLLFDDAPHNLIHFQNEGGISVAMDYPYNRDLLCPRVSNWLEFEELLKKL